VRSQAAIDHHRATNHLAVNGRWIPLAFQTLMKESFEAEIRLPVGEGAEIELSLLFVHLCVYVCVRACSDLCIAAMMDVATVAAVAVVVVVWERRWPRGEENEQVLE
jgi:hypothetical protein